MRYTNVCLETIACRLPDEVVASSEIERRLAPLYRRLRLPEGRLELMTGIAQRRFWPPAVRPGQESVATADKAIGLSGIDRRHFGALVHGSVSRDFVEPATACGVHRQLGLPERCAVYDVSNACLGLLSGTLQVANMIELGQIAAGIVVGTESGRALVESTIDHLNAAVELSRQDIKAAFASLTIGAGSAAIVLCDRRLSRTGNRLLGGAVRAKTEHCELCQGGQAGRVEGSVRLPSPSGRGAGGEGGAREARPTLRPAEGGNEPSGQLLMWTDSEALMREGVAAAREAFADFLEELDWSPGDIQKTFCHQVGRAHQRLLFESLGLDPALDYSTFEYLGNTGAVALPMTAAIGIEQGWLQPGDRVALLGIGSGINVVMLGIEWGKKQGA
jgi:3-oxoacyl-[acyl-carrier-protein] synthase-3